MIQLRYVPQWLQIFLFEFFDCYWRVVVGGTLECEGNGYKEEVGIASEIGFLVVGERGSGGKQVED
jgi:hypothetical protein